MSVNCYIVCTKCKKSLWIGQDGLTGWTFYRGHPGCMEALGKFFGDHIHREAIRIMTEHQVDAEEYENIEWRDTNHIRNHNQTTSMEDMRYQFGVTKDGKQIEALFEGPKAGMVLRFSPNEARKMASDLLIATEVATDHAKQETQ